jgi:hypothetical protein
MTAPHSRPGKDFGSGAWFGMGRKEPLPAQSHLFGMRQFIWQAWQLYHRLFLDEWDWRIKDTFSIVKDGRTQRYMQVSLTFQIWFVAISGGFPIKNSSTNR